MVLRKDACVYPNQHRTGWASPAARGPENECQRGRDLCFVNDQETDRRRLTSRQASKG